MIEWLKSDFEDDPIVDTKAKSTAATASAAIRKDKQMAAAQTTTTTTTTVQQETSVTVATNRYQTRSTKTITKEQVATNVDDTQTTITTTTTESQCLGDVQTENGSMLDAMEHLGMIDDGASSIGIAPSQESWDDLDDLIEKI